MYMVVLTFLQSRTPVLAGATGELYTYIDPISEGQLDVLDHQEASPYAPFPRRTGPVSALSALGQRAKPPQQQYSLPADAKGVLGVWWQTGSPELQGHLELLGERLMIRPWLVKCVAEGRSERMDEGEGRRQLGSEEPALQ